MNTVKPILAVMIGISGSGKSTYANGLKTSLKVENKLDTKSISMDDIRAELTSDAADQSKNAEVFNLTRQRVMAGIKQGNNVIVDVTAPTPKDRRTWIDIAKANGAEARAYFINTPIAVAKKRNLSRARVVPDFVIDRQFSKLVPPRESEGFDSVTTVNG